MNIDFSVITNNLDAITHGFGITLGTWLAGTALALMLGLAISVLQLYCSRPIRMGLRAYIEIVRGTPFLIQLFLLYYGGPSIGLELDPVPAGTLGLAIYGSAYFAEIFRGGFNSIPKGQLEAATCLGLTRWQAIYRIKLPQMLIIIVPALTNMIIILSKETAVLSVITVPELTGVLTGIGTASFAFMEILIVLCLGYLALVELTSHVGHWVERRVGRFMLR